MEIDAEFVEKRRSQLNEEMSRIIFPWIEDDLFYEYGAVPFVNRLNAELSAIGLREPPTLEDIENERIFENSLGVFKGASLYLSAFGVSDCYLREGKGSNPLEHLMLMERCIGVTVGALMFCRKAHIAGKTGGKARAKKYDMRKNRVLEIYLKMPGAADMSADAVAEEIIGIDGVDLSFRKIADTVRQARKMQYAEQNAQDAE